VVIAAGSDWSSYTCSGWANAFGITYPILDDDNNTIYPLFGTGYIPHNIIIDGQGVVLYSQSGFNQSAIFSCPVEAGDITQDGIINVLDVIGLVQIILGGNQQQAIQYLQQIMDPIMFKQLTQELLMMEAPKLLAWPNPSNSVMNINGYGYVQIYDMLGKEVYENYLNGHHIWDTRNLPSGIYHLFNNGETTTVTLLK
jgi:hypothetical protein